MRKSIVFALATVAVAIAGTAGATTSKARLSISGTRPVVVRGTHFLSRERVTVKLTTSTTSVHRVRATRLGTFQTSFDVPTDRCSAFVVRAVGGRGSLAIAKRPMPMCLPARSGGGVAG